jgi:hypothetical protein
VRRKCLIAIFTVAIVKSHPAFAAPVEIPIEIREGLPWIKAAVPTTGAELNLLLDTGAGATVLNTATAKQLGLTLGVQISVHGVETTLSGYSLRPPILIAEGFQLPKPSLAVDLGKFSASCAKPVDGLLGADFFRGRIVQIDFEGKTLRLLPPGTTQQAAKTTSLEFRRCGMCIPISVNGRKAQMVRLDTGCLSSLQWVTSEVSAKDCSHQVAIGLSELSIPQIKTDVKIGAFEFKDVPTGLHEKPIFRGEAGLLGNGLLCRFSRVTIDAKSGHLLLEPRVVPGL